MQDTIRCIVTMLTDDSAADLPGGESLFQELNRPEHGPEVRAHTQTSVETQICRHELKESCGISHLAAPPSARTMLCASGVSAPPSRQPLLQDVSDGEMDDDEAALAAAADWDPDPVTADPRRSSRTRRMSDVIAALVGIYGSKELFITEYRCVFGVGQSAIVTHSVCPSRWRPCLENVRSN